MPTVIPDDAAEFLMSFVEHDPDAVQLSLDQQKEVARRINDPDRTLATDDEVEAVYRKLGA